jgi:hypothetical protein
MATATAPYRLTADVARLLEVSYGHLVTLIFQGVLKAPARRSGRAYLWSKAEVARAREILECRREQARYYFLAKSKAILNTKVKVDVNDPKYRKKKAE